MKTWLLKNRTALTQAFFAALAAPLALAFTALGIYFANIMELPGNPAAVCTAVFIQVAIGVLLLFVVQLPFIGCKIFSWGATTLFTLGFLFWFQANVFNWDFGLLDGREIPWKSYTPLGIFELCVYGITFSLAFRFKNKLLEHIVPISCILILMQVIPVSLAMVKTLTQNTAMQAEQTEDQPEHNISIPSWKQYTITYDVFFEFSQEENVVLVILDELGKKFFDDIKEEHPEEIDDIFRDFTYFTSALCNVSLTRYCIPQILTGCAFEELPDDFVTLIQHNIFNREGTLLKTLSENQYRCDVFSGSPYTVYFDSRWISNIRFNNQQGSIADISELTVFTLFRSMPTLLKRNIIRSNRLRGYLHFAPLSHYDSYRPILIHSVPDYEFNTWINTDSKNYFTERKTFKFIHLQGAHRPYTMDENCMPTAKSTGKRQALGSLRIIKNLLELMKESDVYDQSLIIVMSDHGPAPFRSEYAPLVSQDPSIPLRPSFFIKRKHTQQPQLAYNDNPIHITDTTPIILSELGILQGEDAFSPFEMTESLVKERKNQWESIWNQAK